MKKINKIKRADYDRVLITETLPYETPIIFSNDGLYDVVRGWAATSGIQKTLIDSLIFGGIFQKKAHSTVPYTYKIRKNAAEFRRLALIHPNSQWKIKCFYEKNEKLILHYCSVSPASIRAPNKVAGSFYSKNSWENVNQYKTGNVAISSLDRYSKHTPSYFAYRGYDRLYKFFNSKEYFALEKKFSTLLTLDVSKCFDSIYTHSLAWATKDKQFTKQNVQVETTFGNEFDEVIRHGNHNETNGIPIGPETSRIFAEIIFQEVDRRSICKLEPLKFGKNYVFYRYVDDVFIFAGSLEIARLVYNNYSDVLTSFNLHANALKSESLSRPFATKKSRLAYEAGRASNEFFEKFLLQEGDFSLTPQRIFSPWKLTKNYLDSIKSLCAQDQAGYDDLASFLISIVTERIKKIVHCPEGVLTEESRANYTAAIEILLDVVFFFYSVAPSVSASYKLSTAIILSHRFVIKHTPVDAPRVTQRIYDLSFTLLSEHSEKIREEGIDGFVHLECLNLVLAIRELGEHHLLPEAIIDKLFIASRKLSYFTIVSCLFYIKDSPQYLQARAKLLAAASEKLKDLSDIAMSSEKTYLLLDMLSCPYATAKEKANWVRALYKVLGTAPPSKADIAAFVATATQIQWQINWIDVDLLNSLEKKELKQAY